MECDEDYDDKKERLCTDPRFLSFHMDIMINMLNGNQELDHRSVLDRDIKAPVTLWNMSSNQVDMNNMKAR